MELNQIDRFERRNPSLAIIKETSDNINDKNKNKNKGKEKEKVNNKLIIFFKIFLNNK